MHRFAEVVPGPGSEPVWRALPAACPPRSRPLAPRPLTLVLLASGALLALGCGGEESGEVQVAVYGEDFIEEGIPAADFADGWAVSFDRFLVSLGEVNVGRGHGAPALSAPAQKIYDLAGATMKAGLPVASKLLDGGDYDHLTYQIGPARTGAQAGNPLAADALAAMVAGGESVRVAGAASKGGRTVRFDWGFAARTDHTCHVGLQVDGAAARAEITIHGYHLFYDDLVAAEPNLAFELIAAADADQDGTVSRAELLAQDIRGQARYQVGNAAVTNLWDFIAYQATTLGHVNGEGHCETSTQ